MTTRAATFSAKVRNLTDYYQRAMNNAQQPLQGMEIVNTLRYFSQTLHGLLKDAQQNVSWELFASKKNEEERLGLFQSLNYVGLYNAITNIIDILPVVTNGQIALGSAIVNTLDHLYIFLDHDTLEQMPYNTAALLLSLPDCLHDDVINSLTHILLPYVLKDEKEESYVTATMASVLLTVFQHSSNPAHHSQLLECLMSQRPNVFQDVISVIACGGSDARIPAANLLFHYWPFLNPNVMDRRTVQYRPQGGYKPEAWTQHKCQHRSCADSSERLAVKKCYQPNVCAEVGDIAPPMFLCQECSVALAHEFPETTLADLIQPMPSTLSSVCVAGGCPGGNRMAIGTCFDMECMRENQMQPMRLCQECHDKRHKDKEHLFHARLPSPWDCTGHTYIEFVHAVVSLLKECSCTVENELDKRPRWLQQLENQGQEEQKQLSDERRMLSRYGIWLLVGLCTPREDSPVEAIGHLLAMLFQWFGVTALLSNDATGASLEQLKNEYVCDWLPNVVKSHFEVFVDCLLPRPPEYARVGGTWEHLSSRTDQLKEGLSRILALIPYDIITYEAWDRIMPYWLDAIATDIPEPEQQQLKILLCKIFEIDMCPLPFPPEEIYHFIGCRLVSDDFSVQQQALDWIQVLSGLDIMIPLEILIKIFIGAVHVHSPVALAGSKMEASLKSPADLSESSTKDKPSLITKSTGYDQDPFTLDSAVRTGSALSQEDSPMAHSGLVCSGDEESNAGFFVLMLDVIIKQIELSEIKKHVGVEHATSQQLLKCAAEIVRGPWYGKHICDDPEFDDFVDCYYCREATIFYELLADITKHLCPKEEVKIELHPEIDYDALWEETETETQPFAGTDELGLSVTGMSMRKSVDTVLDMEGMSMHGGMGYNPGGNADPMQTIMQAHEQVAMEDIECVGVLPTEEIETAMAQAVTLTETDVGMATCNVASAQLVEGDEGSGAGAGLPGTDVHYWYTSQGKFRFALEELPAQLQLVYALMIDVEKHPDPDVSYYLLQCLKYICLHAEALNNAHSEARGFLIWAQENILISKFWKLLQAQYSHVSQMCVPLILHCLTLPSGPEVFWRFVNSDFANPDWTIRFNAVEKVTVICRFVDPTPVRGNPILQAALANAFSFLISSAHDPNANVSQRAILSMETIPSSALKSLCGCLEAQFDAVIVDRPLLIHRLFLLSTLLPDQPVLTWDFYLARLDALTLEAQLKLEKTGEIAFATDLMHSDPTSDLYYRKIQRARNAVEQGGQPFRSIINYMDNVMPHHKTMSYNLTSRTSRELLDGAAPSSGKSSKASGRGSKTASTGLDLGAAALGKLREFTDEESNFANLLNKAMDLENPERHTMYLILVLFMKFLSSPKITMVNPDEKAAAKKQSIVLRHINVLLGYNTSEKSFTLPPFRLRASAICNAFLSCLPEVLDQNLLVGQQILPTATALLQYLPSPQRYASDAQPPNYSIWYLEPHTRHCWLWSLLLILYKYRFNQQPFIETVLFLVQIVMNTLEAQTHQCKHVEEVSHSPLFPSTRESSEIESGASDSEDPDFTESSELSSGRIKHVLTAGTGMGTAHHKRRLMSQSRKPTFDEREEQMLEEEEAAQRKLIAVDSSPALLRDTHPGSRTGVDGQIIQQIDAFDRSFDASNAEHTRRMSLSSPQMDIVTEGLTPALHAKVSITEPRVLISHGRQPGRRESNEARSHGSATDFFIGDFSHSQKIPDNGGMIDMSQFEDLSRMTPLNSEGTSPVMLGELEMSPHEELATASTVDRPKVIVCQATEEGSFEDNFPNSGMVRLQSAVFSHPVVVEPGKAPPFESSSSVKIFDPQGLAQPTELVRVTPVEMIAIDSPRRLGRLTKDQSIEVAPGLLNYDVVEMDSLGGGMIHEGLVKPTSINLDNQCVPLRAIGDNLEGDYDGESAASTDRMGRTEPEVHSSVKMMPSLMEPPTVRLDAISEEGGFADRMEKRSEQQHLSVPSSLAVPGLGKDGSGKVQAKASAQRHPSSGSVGGIPAGAATDSSATSGGGGGGQQQGGTSASLRYAESTVMLRCQQCNTPLEQYDEETLGLAITCLSTFVHREPSMAAPFLIRMFQNVGRIVNETFFPWQGETNLFVPGNCRSVARQFIRVVLHQLAPNRLFLEMFQADIQDIDFFKAMVSSLTDFPELNPVSVIQILFEDLNDAWSNELCQIFYNLADYLSYSPLDGFLTTWASVVQHMDTFFRRYTAQLGDLPADLTYLLRIVSYTLRISNFSSFKFATSLMDPLSKLLSSALQTAPIKMEQLLDLATNCNRAFIKDRDKQSISRCIVNELVNALKFKTVMPQDNYITIVQVLLQDVGESISDEIDATSHLYSTGASDAARPCLQDFIDFVGDLLVLNKIKNVNFPHGSTFREDTLGGELKAALSRYIAVEIARGAHRDTRQVVRFLPWLYNPPSVTQQGPNEFVECVAHVRLLAWLLLGALLHDGTSECLPIPLDASTAISDHIQFVLAGFAEQSKESVLHMSALFHAFHLCQLWTMYCEQAAKRLGADSDNPSQACHNVMDFWCRITPAILQLLSHSKVLADMVNLHFLNTVEALQECNSNVLSKLYPMWQPVLLAYHSQVPVHLVVRLDAVENRVPVLSGDGNAQLKAWLRRIQLKISKIELQSAVATQFYSV